MADGKKKIWDFDDFQRYLAGRMSPGEEHAFEKHLLDDEFAREALEGMAQLSGREREEDMKALKKRLRAKTAPERTFPLWRIAASLALLGLTSFLIYYLINTGPVTVTEQTVPEKKVEKGLAIHGKEDTSNLREDGTLALEQDIKQDEEVVSEPPPVVKMKKATEKPSGSHEKMTIIEVPDEQEITEDIEVELNAGPIDEPAEAEYEAPAVTEEVAPPETRKKQFVQPLARTATVRAPEPGTNKKLLEIHGVVTSAEDGLPLPGVNVIAENTNVGTVTNIDGKFTIKAPGDSSATLSFNFIGYNTETVKVSGKDSVFVRLEPDVSALSEVVVMAYGVQNTGERPEERYIPPKPAGGMRRLRKYIKENLQYPSGKDIKGAVVLRLTIATDGNISDIKVVKSPGREFADEALRLIIEGPEWKPATRNGITEEAEVTVRIRFRPPG